MFLGLDERRVNVQREVLLIAAGKHPAYQVPVHLLKSLQVAGLTQPDPDGIGTGQPVIPAQLPQTIVPPKLPDVLQRPTAAAQHHDQRQDVLMKLEPADGAWSRQVPLDVHLHTQCQRRHMDQYQPGPAGDGIRSRIKLEIQTFLRYTASNHLAAFLLTWRVKSLYTH